MSNVRLHSISKQRRKKYGANAPQLHPILKKYGANAPQLHPIRCSLDFYVMLCNEQAKKPKNTAQTRHSCTLFLLP